MELDHAKLFETLGHPKRLDVFRLLARRYPQSVPAGEIADALGLKANTLSTYVSSLMQANLIENERQGVSIRYKVSMPALEKLLAFLALDCGRGRADLIEPLVNKARHDGTAPYNVLFLCTANSARSIMSECLLRDIGGHKFNVYSAGSYPAGDLNPKAVELLTLKDHDTSGLTSKHMSIFQKDDAPVMDFVFTVCDRMANEDCPAWEGQPISGHWGIPDPAKVKGNQAEVDLAYQQAYGALKNRIKAFAALPIETLDRVALQTAVDELAT